MCSLFILIGIFLFGFGFTAIVPVTVQSNAAVIEMLNEGVYGEDASPPATALPQKRAYISAVQQAGK